VSESRLFLVFPLIGAVEWFLIECRKMKTKSSEPIKTRHKYVQPTRSAEKRVRTPAHDRAIGSGFTSDSLRLYDAVTRV